MSATETADSRQYVTFQLGAELFGVAVSRAREILSLVPVTRVPQTPDYLLGVINLRGQVVPVVDLRIKLGIAKGEMTQESCVIVMEMQLDGEALIVGGLADSVSEVLELRDDQIEPPPRMGTRLKTEFIAGMGKIEEQFLILLDIDRVFSVEDGSLLQVVSEDAQPSRKIEEA